MIEFIVQEPFVPEGITLRVEVSIYEAQWVPVQIQAVAKMLYHAERQIQKAEAKAEQDASNG